MRDTKHWIQTIANAEEADYIDLSTPKVRAIALTHKLWQ